MEWTACGTFFTHVQTCDVTHVQVARNGLLSVRSSHMSKPVMQLVFKVLRSGLLSVRTSLTCRNLWCNSCPKLLRNGLLSVHTSHMSKPVMSLVFKVLRNGLASVHPSHIWTDGQTTRFLFPNCKKHRLFQNPKPSEETTITASWWQLSGRIFQVSTPCGPRPLLHLAIRPGRLTVARMATSQLAVCEYWIVYIIYDMKENRTSVVD